ncbi:MAG: aminotransferase class IV [Bacteroidales bacterium]|nr:aminotransferase class IV [Bacteroidales bacterium]
MFLLFETIRIEEGVVQNIEYHNQRFLKARKHFFRMDNIQDLSPLIHCPDQFKTGRIKCRIDYADKIYGIQFEPYKPRIIRSLKLVESAGTHYAYKYSDRAVFDRLKQGIPEDDILITRKGFLTDISFANIALKEGDQWFTPSNPLLEGTRREALLISGKLKKREIYYTDLEKFTEIRIINAMLDLKDHPALYPENVAMY